MRLFLVALVALCAVSAAGCQDIRQTVVLGGSPTAPSSTDPQPPAAGEVKYASLNFELWSANSNGTPNQMLERVAGPGPDGTVLFQGTYTAGTVYVFKPCVDVSGIPESQHAGREYTLSSKPLSRVINPNREINEGPMRVSSGNKCFNQGFSPDRSGEVFTVILNEFGGNVPGQHSLKNTATVRAR